MIEEICNNKDSWIVVGVVTLCKEIFEYWLGKTDKVSAGSSLELILNFFKVKKIKNKESSMQVGKLQADLVGGHIVVKYNVGSEELPSMVELSLPAGALLMPALSSLEAKVMSGEIDPIKGTDFDKELLLKGLGEAKKALA